VRIRCAHRRFIVFAKRTQFFGPFGGLSLCDRGVAFMPRASAIVVFAKRTQFAG
jgi:hypothetical protein